jgi:hypothetical protein
MIDKVHCKFKQVRCRESKEMEENVVHEIENTKHICRMSRDWEEVCESLRKQQEQDDEIQILNNMDELEYVEEAIRRYEEDDREEDAIRKKDEDEKEKARAGTMGGRHDGIKVRDFEI